MVQILASEFKLNPIHIENIIKLIDEGNTIPFIARYRKELTGGVDDQVLRDLADRLTYLRNLQKRREEVIASIAEQGKITDELIEAITNAKTLTEVEDIYRPFKPKRQTRATIAIARGLEPLSDILLAQQHTESELEQIALDYINEEKGVTDTKIALSGASDIIAEKISDDAYIRKFLREFIIRHGVVAVKAADKDKDSVYTMYYDFSEPIGKIANHRVLAINRGEAEGFLKVSLTVDEARTVNMMIEDVLDPSGKCPELIKYICGDSWSRLIFPSLEREVRNMLTDNAHEQAIKMFATNLEPLLMQPPIKNTTTMGVDPAYRTGCKIAVVDHTGKLLTSGVVYPTPPQSKVEEAKDTLKKLIKKYNVTTIAIGNGTASGETENFISELISEIPEKVSYMVVNEAGASVYSASKLAAKEFPALDVSIRSAISIARRLQDPLAELVKIDPKSIGIGQYQHDMPPARLSETLGGVVENCVNRVGVDLNTASFSLLSYVSGISDTLSKNIVTYREENGVFTSRSDLKKVPKLGPKAFEQCAGFLRIPESKNVFDNTGVHPESYTAAEKLLKLLDVPKKEVGKVTDLKDRITAMGEAKVCEELGIGVPTLRDIVTELLKPGRDPRDELPPPLLRSGILDISDLKAGMEIKGTVRNVIDFGAFVDIGVHQDGLVHISQITNRYIRHPSEVLTVGDIVTVWVLNIDKQKGRISLTMKKESLQTE